MLLAFNPESCFHGCYIREFEFMSFDIGSQQEEIMKAIFCVIATMLASAAYAQDFGKHPHLKAAHNKIEKAMEDLQHANNGKEEFGGHREKAEELLKQALTEVQAAAEFANQHPGHK